MKLKLVFLCIPALLCASEAPPEYNPLIERQPEQQLPPDVESTTINLCYVDCHDSCNNCYCRCMPGLNVLSNLAPLGTFVAMKLKDFGELVGIGSQNEEAEQEHQVQVHHAVAYEEISDADESGEESE